MGFLQFRNALSQMPNKEFVIESAPIGANGAPIGANGTHYPVIGMTLPSFDRFTRLLRTQRLVANDEVHAVAAEDEFVTVKTDRAGQAGGHKFDHMMTLCCSYVVVISMNLD
jgi:hypothetical protein